MKKILAIALALVVVCAAFAGCSNGSGNSSTSANNSSSAAQNSSSNSSSSENTANDLGEITVISREDGSGTRTAFIELTGVEADGTDQTYEDAVFVNSTDQVLTQVSENEAAIGYVSLGSLNDTVKAVPVDGVEPTAENVKAGDYKISRPFMIATKGEATGVAADFINFILSQEGQAIVNEEGYIAVDDAATAFESAMPEGTITVGGSSSVGPVMEKLAEAYMAVNTGATIELQVTDSSSGMNGAIDGTLDIGMASRALKDSETAELTGIQIAVDGIAVIVNNANAVEDLSVETIRQIFTGEVTDWSEVQ